MKTLEAVQLQLPLNLAVHSSRFTFIDLFAGIGGFRIALNNLGGSCLAYSEIDKEALKVYQANHLSYLNQDEISLGDITQVDQLPTGVDIVVGGVPCQPWSVAGKLKGFDDPRGKLWFNVISLLAKSQPKSFIFENVRGLASPKNRENLEFLIQQFEQIGYRVYWEVINAYDFGLPQNRERVFIVGIHQRIKGHDQYRFPAPLKTNPRLLDILDPKQFDLEPIEKVKLDPDILFGGVIPPSRNRFQKDDELNDFFVFSDLRNGHTTIHSWDLIKTTAREKMICLTILKNRRRKQYGEKDGNPLSYDDLSQLISGLKVEELEALVEKKILRKTVEPKYEFVNSKNMSGINGVYRVFLPTSTTLPTLTATGAKDFIATRSIHGDNPEDYKRAFLTQIYRKGKYLPIVAKHACRLQGFPDDFKYHPREEVAKKQFGNAVPVPVVEFVAKELLKVLLI
ncbi:DNA cytosine methyltransferase [Spirulina subsalsa]|uniref:DNA cytosine methyltransferase n=1 Tax=Spirulina subsalsa TaxID=54311 RepID=UPI0002FF7A69|nr:DNA cytosine methyltransferase [Spirulina subsalsa]